MVREHAIHVGVSMTDLSVPADNAEPMKERFPFSFHGGASEFFGIWIVNLLLTIVTLGIYSAWAKVRTTRYFYGNTQVDGHGFAYHAEPVKILIGRIIAVLIITFYSMSQLIDPMVYVGLTAVLLIAIPWLINRSLRFTARMTSYRNVRFDFHGNYWRALWVFLIGPILAFFTLFLLMPVIARAGQRYLADSFTYGGRPMVLTAGLGPFYWAYFLGFLILLALAAVATAVVIAAVPMLEGFDPSVLEEGQLPPPNILILFAAGYLLVLGMFAIAPIFVQTMITNITFNNLVLDEKHEFESAMNPATMVWIVVTNLLLIIVTYGLMIPWARVRVAKYRADRTALLAGGPLDQYTSTVAQESAIGEEVAQAFDLEIPI